MMDIISNIQAGTKIVPENSKSSDAETGSEEFQEVLGGNGHEIRGPDQLNLVKSVEQVGNSSAGMNAELGIAGPAPWSKEWVFGRDMQSISVAPEKGPELTVTKAVDMMGTNVSPFNIGMKGSDLTKAAQSEFTPEMGVEQKLTEKGAVGAVERQVQSRTGVSNQNVVQFMAQNQMSPKLSPMTGTKAGNSAKNATVTGVSDAALMSAINKLNGQIEEVGTTPDTVKHVLNSAVPGSSTSRGAAELSGVEYLGMMNGVKGKNQGMQSSGFSQNFDNSQDMGGSQQGLQARVKALSDNAREHTSVDSQFSNRLNMMATGHQAAPASANVGISHVSTVPVELAGHVVPGAMTQERLSTESLVNLSAGIRNLGPNGTGEMRIRLKPEKLGELRLLVSTRGNHVGLKIMASNGSAKSVIEESLSHLRSNLATQSLNLGKVDVSIAQPISNSFVGSNAQDSHAMNYSANEQNQYQSGKHSGSSGDNDFDTWSERERLGTNGPAPLRKAAVPSGRSPLGVVNGHVDLRV